MKERLAQLYALIAAKLPLIHAQVPKEKLTALAYDLRHTMEELDATSPKHASNQWQNNIKTLRQYIIDNRDPFYFLDWPVIQSTMVATKYTREELAEIKQKQFWHRYRSAFRESQVGHPKRYLYAMQSSANLIHSAYNIFQLTEAFSVDIRQLHRIVEFGAGYGSLCRLLYQMGFNGSYTIFDLPEFLALQKYFLSAIGFYGKRHISLTASTNTISEIARNPDLFIAMWSISESPLEIRREFIRHIGHPRFIIIGFQESFDGINNKIYFDELRSSMPGYEWKEQSIKHVSGSYYLLGKKL